MMEINDFVALAPAHRCIFLPTRDAWRNEAVDMRLKLMPLLDAAGNLVTDSKGKAKMIPASQWLAKHRSVERTAWAPGEPVFIDGKLLVDDGWISKIGSRTLNLYLPPLPYQGDAALATRWRDHWFKLYPADAAEHCIAWLAHRTQHPDVKPNHGLVLVGKPDIGKDTLLVPVRDAVGPWNFRDIALNDLVNKNNDFLCAVIVRVNEARDAGENQRGRIDRYGLHDHMKGLMTSPPETHRINRKYLPEYVIRSLMGFVITSNHFDALYLPEDDRRHLVAMSECTRTDFHKEFFDEFYHWYTKENGIGHVVAYLHQYDLSNFNPKLAPIKTAAFWRMVDVDRGLEHGELTDTIEKLAVALGLSNANGDRRTPDALTIDLLLKVDPNLEWLSDRKKHRAIQHRMQRCGYISVQNPEAEQSGGLWKINGKRQTIYANAKLSADQRLTAAQQLKKRLTSDLKGGLKLVVNT
jgi:hypothetical protein